MTKEELKQAELTIINEFGQPEWDGMRGPVNESAIKLAKLRSLYKGERAQKARLDAKKQKGATLPHGLAVNPGKQEVSFHLPAALDSDLITFSSEDQKIILAYFQSLDKSSPSIAELSTVSMPKVRAFLASGRWQTFLSKALMVMKGELGIKWFSALVSCLTSENEAIRMKAVEMLGHDLGLIRKHPLNEDNATPQIEITPELAAKLKELGDQSILG